MAEETESVRKDSSARQLEKKDIVDWSGKRLVLPRGTTLPPSGRAGEIFVRTFVGGAILSVWDDSAEHWSTVGTQT